MCTITLLPRRGGYALAMNRDEKLARIIALPPRSQTLHGAPVLFPAEPSGGTWITLNDTGVTLALINWYAIPQRVKSRAISRGEVVHAAGSSHVPGLAAEMLARLPLAKINPFRLVGVFPATCEAVEWQWNLATLVRKNHPWTSRQWISSGFDEPLAQRLRSRTFRRAQSQGSAASLDWLRRLHRSHAPGSGPFSTCMHREDAATVSYTEVLVSSQAATMRYQAGAPCQGATVSSHQLKRRKF